MQIPAFSKELTTPPSVGPDILNPETSRFNHTKVNPSLLCSQVCVKLSSVCSIWWKASGVLNTLYRDIQVLFLFSVPSYTPGLRGTSNFWAFLGVLWRQSSWFLLASLTYRKASFSFLCSKSLFTLVNVFSTSQNSVKISFTTTFSSVFWFLIFIYFYVPPL